MNTPIAEFCGLLAIYHSVAARPHGNLAQVYRDNRPELLKIAEKLQLSDWGSQLQDNAFAQIESLWGDLCRTQMAGSGRSL